jgi:hypothetical protein
MNSFIKIIAGRWKIIIPVVFVAGVFGFFYATVQKISYQSRLTFALDAGESSGGMSGALSLAAQFGLNVGGGKDVFAGDNILEIMKSRRMVEKVLLVVDTFDGQPTTLIQYYLTKMSTPKKNIAEVAFPPFKTKEQLNYRQDSVLYSVYKDIIQQNISTEKPDRKLNIYEVNFTSSSEKFSKVFTDRLVSATNEFYTEICSKKARETLQILESRVSNMKGNLNSSISNKAYSVDANLNPAFAATQVPIQKEQVNIQVYTAAYGEMFKNLELARYQYLKQVPLMQVIDPADYPMKKIKASRLVYALVFSFITFVILVVLYISKYLWSQPKTEP